IDWRYAEGRNERYIEFATEMAEARADLVVTGTSTAVRAVVGASKRMPVVTFGVPDPVSSGLVASLAHPGGQVTGMTNFSEDLVPKRIELFKAAVPSLTRLAFVRCPECALLGGDSMARITALFDGYRTIAQRLGFALIEAPLNSDLEFPAVVQ